MNKTPHMYGGKPNIYAHDSNKYCSAGAMISQKQEHDCGHM